MRPTVPYLPQHRTVVGVRRVLFVTVQVTRSSEQAHQALNTAMHSLARIGILLRIAKLRWDTVRGLKVADAEKWRQRESDYVHVREMKERI